MLDISGQEIMTADKVTLRLNALVSYRITDALRSVAAVDEAGQALYRAAQLALREAVGAKDLDAFIRSFISPGRMMSLMPEATTVIPSSTTRGRIGDEGLANRVVKLL